MRSRRGWVGLALLAMAVVACGASDDAGTTTTTTVATTTSTIATTTTSSVPTTIPATTSTSVKDSTTTTGTSSGLPGEPIDFGPAEGDVVAVVGVAHDDVLNLREGPGADQGILEGIPPLYDSLTAQGRTRQLTSGAMWILVDYAGTDGWVNLRFIAYLGNTSDITAAVVEDFGDVPGGETMLDLGRAVAESLAGDISADIVISVAPTIGDLGEVTFDVTGFEDDSVRGSRIHVFGQPIDEAFVLDSVEATPLCARGVDEDGYCV